MHFWKKHCHKKAPAQFPLKLFSLILFTRLSMYLWYCLSLCWRIIHKQIYEIKTSDPTSHQNIKNVLVPNIISGTFAYTLNREGRFFTKNIQILLCCWSARSTKFFIAHNKNWKYRNCVRKRPPPPPSQKNYLINNRSLFLKLYAPQPSLNARTVVICVNLRSLFI